MQPFMTYSGASTTEGCALPAVSSVTVWARFTAGTLMRLTLTTSADQCLLMIRSMVTVVLAVLALIFIKSSAFERAENKVSVDLLI